MKIVIAGASGLIGTPLVQHLRNTGHEVVVLVRRPPRSAHEVQWNPKSGELDPAAISGADAVIGLSGAGVGDKRWTAAYKKEILDSRTTAIGTLAKAIAAAEVKPHVFIAGSAIGFYGERGQEVVTEASPRGTGFLSDVVVAWEAAAQPARDAGVRTVHIRTGLVVSGKGGALAKMIPLFKLGLGGTLGGGKQRWSMISLTDEIRAIEFLVTHDVHGPVNLTAPDMPSNAQVTSALARVLRRPAILPVPAFALKLVLGEFSVEITGSAAVKPEVLQNAGFEWQHPTIESALRAELSR